MNDERYDSPGVLVRWKFGEQYRIFKVPGVKKGSWRFKGGVCVTDRSQSDALMVALKMRKWDIQ